MSFELRVVESIRKNIRRIARKQLDRVIELLTAERPPSRDEVIHEVRVAFKKVRALLRLVRPEIGEKAYKEENSCLRDAARPLTEVRDAKILVDVLDGLVAHYAEQISGRAFDHVRGELQTRLRAVRFHKASTVRSAADRTLVNVG